MCSILYNLTSCIHTFTYTYSYTYTYYNTRVGLSTSLSQELVKRLEKSSATSEGATSDPHYTTQYASILVTARKLQREKTLASLSELFQPYKSPFVGGDLAWIGGSLFGSVKVCTSICMIYVYMANVGYCMVTCLYECMY